MMGQHSRSEALFYCFRLDDQVPETHLLRLIEKHISFAFVREKLKDSYSQTGRPSIDPELLLRILLIGYLYGITSERKLVEELRMHLAWRWFTGVGFDQENRRFDGVRIATVPDPLRLKFSYHISLLL
jgi:transposase